MDWSPKQSEVGAVSDIGSRIQESKNWFERAAEYVPGYKGYKSKELRREADKLQRMYVAERLEAARRILEELQLALSRQGNLELLGIMDTAQRKLRTVKDRYLFADYGYAGWFNAVKVKDDQLDQMYQLDVGAQEQARGIEEFMRAMSAESPTLRADISLLEQRVEALDEYFLEREHVITGVGR
jgi:hypothetical protein